MTLVKVAKTQSNEVRLCVSVLVFTIISIILAAILILFSQPLQAASNNTFKFQGKIVNVTNGTNLNPGSPACVIAGPSNDTCDFRVRYYSASTGGTLFATEEFNNIEIGEYNGVFSYTLGTGVFTAGSESNFENIFINNGTVYYEIGFAPLGSNLYTETFLDGTNRPQISGSPYALVAGAVDGGLDTVYENDNDKILNIDNILGLELISTTIGNITLDLDSTGDFVLQDNNATFLTISDTGGFNYILDSIDNPSFVIENQGSGVVQINETGTTTPNLIDLLVASNSRFRVTNDGRIESNINGVSQAFQINYNHSLSDISSAITIQNSGTAAIINAIDLSDPEIQNGINLGNNNIQMTNDGSISINDSLNNQVVLITDSSTNFGGSVESGAVISRNAYIGEEFSRERANLTADRNQVWGDYQQFGVDENTVCTFSTLDDTINGIGRMNVGIAGGSCLAYHSAAVGNAHLQFNISNLPLVIMKVRPSAVSATQNLWVGLGTSAAATTIEPTDGVYFTNNNGTTWTGVTRNAGVSTNVVCTGQTISTTQFALLKIETRSTTDVRFYVDNDVSNGVQWFECGSSATNIYTAGNMTSMIMNASTPAGMNLDIDYYRVWQDDADVIGSANIPNSDDLNNTFENSALKQESNTEPLEEPKTPLQLNPNNEIEADNEQISNEDISNDLVDNIDNIDNIDITEDQSDSDNNSSIDENSSFFYFSKNTEGFIQVTNCSDCPDQIKFDSHTVSFNNLIVTGSITLLGDLSIERDLKVTGDVFIGNKNLFSLEFSEGETEKQVIFTEEKEVVPIIFVSSDSGVGSSYEIFDKTNSGFKIKLNEPPETLVKFNILLLYNY